MAISHGFNKTEAATSVTAPVTVNSGLQIVVVRPPLICWMTRKQR